MQLRTDQLIQEKIQAALTRAKPRNFYDIYFLLRAHMIQPKDKPLLKKLQTFLKKTDLNFAVELREFLPVAFHPIIRNFRDVFIKEVDKV